MIGAYTARRSGAHLNPAVTLCFCIFRKFSWKKLPVYAAAQVLGALLAAAVVYGNYKSAFDAFAGHNVLIVPGGPGNQSLATAGIFNTYPAPFLQPVAQLFSEVVAAAVLLFSVFAILDEGNIGAGPFLPVGLFFIIFAIGSSFGWQTGFAINPARDFGPRLMTYMLGYGPSVWTVGHHYFWVSFIHCSEGRNILT
jgi:aquaglyceroporin related protein